MPLPPTHTGAHLKPPLFWSIHDITSLCCHLELLFLGPTAAPVPDRTVIVTLDNSTRESCPIRIDRGQEIFGQERFPCVNSSGLRELGGADRMLHPVYFREEGCRMLTLYLPPSTPSNFYSSQRKPCQAGGFSPAQLQSCLTKSAGLMSHDSVGKYAHCASFVS